MSTDNSKINTTIKDEQNAEKEPLNQENTEKKAAQSILFDSSNWEHMRELMRNHEQYPEMLFGTNENGEDIHLSVNEDHLIVVTYQNNHWIRKNIYHDDGYVEELFEGKW